MSDRTRRPGEPPGSVTLYHPDGRETPLVEPLPSAAVTLSRVPTDFWGRPDLKRHAENLADLKVVGERTIDLYDVNDRLEQRRQRHRLTCMGRRDLPERHRANVEAWLGEQRRNQRAAEREDERAELEHEIEMAELMQKHEEKGAKAAAARDTADIEGEIHQSEALTRKYQADAKRDAAEAQAIEAKCRWRESQRELDAFDDPSRGGHAPTPEMKEATKNLQRKRHNERTAKEQIEAILAKVGGDRSRLTERELEDIEDLEQAIFEANTKVDTGAAAAAVRPNGRGGRS